MKRHLGNARLWLPVVLATGIGLAVAGVSRAEGESGDDLVATGSRPDVVFLHTGDVIGYLEPCG